MARNASKQANRLQEFEGVRNILLDDLQDLMDYYGFVGARTLSRADRDGFTMDAADLLLELSFNEPTALLVIAGCSTAIDRFEQEQDYHTCANLQWLSHLVAERFQETIARR